MLGFDPTPEQEALREMVHKFAANEIRPRAAEWDRDGSFPMELFRKAFDLGLMTGFIPESYGGQGLSALDTCFLEEEISWGCSGVATSMTANGLALGPILLVGTEEQKRSFVAPFATAFRFASFCLTEPGAGSDAGGIAATARRDGDSYVLNGRKCFITNGAHASQYTVFASTDRSRGHRGLSAFIVPRETPGVSSGKKEDKMGQRASETTDVLFEDVRVPEANRLGAEGEGFKIAMRTIDYARAGIRVNVICPGFFPAEQNRKILSPDRVTTIMSKTPMNRFGESHELIGAAVFLAAKSRARQFPTRAAFSGQREARRQVRDKRKNAMARGRRGLRGGRGARILRLFWSRRASRRAASGACTGASPGGRGGGRTR